MKNEKIVNLRALAIVIVVWGHSIILYSSEWGLYQTTIICPILDEVKYFINMVQMQLFFSISGYLFYYSQKKGKSFLEIIKEKSTRLIVPYICVSLLWLIPIRLLVNYAGYRDMSYIDVFFERILRNYDNGHLWYLITLFLIFIGMDYVCKVLWIKKKDSLYLICGIFFLLVSCFSYKHPIINNTGYYFIWFYIGFVINHYEEKLLRRKRIIGIVVMVLLFFSVISLKIIGRDNNICIAQYLIPVCLLVILYLYVPDRSNNISELIAENSFGIYLFHSPLIYITFSKIPNSSPIIVVFINFVIFGLLAFLITVAVRRVGLSFLIGEKQR